MDRSSFSALSELRARLQAFSSDPKVKTLGLTDFLLPSDDVAVSKISNALSSLVGRALAQASMAPFIIRMLGRSMLSKILSASSVFPFLPKPTIFRSRSALESLLSEVHDVVDDMERAVNGPLGIDKEISFSSSKDGMQSFRRLNALRIDSGLKAFPFSAARRKMKHETKSVLATVSCCRLCLFRQSDGDVIAPKLFILDVYSIALLSKFCFNSCISSQQYVNVKEIMILNELSSTDGRRTVSEM